MKNLAFAFFLAFPFFAAAQNFEQLAKTADSLINLRQFPAGEAVAQKMMDLAAATDGMESYNYQLGLFRMALSTFRQGEVPKSEPIFEQCRAISEKTHGKENPEYCDILLHLARCASDDEDTHKALEIYREAGEIYLKIGWGQKDEYFRARLGEAKICNELGQIVESEQIARQIVAEMDAINFHEKTYAGCMLHLGNLALDQGRYTAALASYNAGRDILLKFRYSEALPCIGSAGLVLESQGDYVGAAAIYEGVLDTIRAKNLQKQLNMAYHVTLENLSGVYHALGLHEKAKAAMQEKIDFFETQYGKDSDNYKLAQKSYAILLLDEGKAAEALPLFEAGLEVAERNYGRNSELPVKNLLALARTHLALNQENEAEKYLRDALDRAQQPGNTAGFSLPGIFLELANLSVRQKNYPVAKDFYQKSLTARARHSETSKEFAEATVQLAILEEKMGNLSSAAEGFEKSNQIYSRLLARGAPALSSHENLQFYKSQKSASETAFSFAYRNPGQISVADLLKNKTLTKNLLARCAQNMNRFFSEKTDAASQNEYQNWLDLREKLSFAYSQNDAAAGDSTILKLEKQAESLEKSLARQSSNFANFISKADFDWKKLLQKLAPDEVAVDITRLHFENLDGATDTILYGIVVVSPRFPDAPQLVFLKNGADLENTLIEQYRTEAKNKRPDLASGETISENIYRQFWQPVEPFLAGAKKVFLSPDGVFNKMNLSTLRKPRPTGGHPGDADGGFLMNEFDISLVTNLHDLLDRAAAVAANSQKNKTFFLLGNPTFDLASSEMPTENQAPGQAMRDADFGNFSNFQNLNETELRGIGLKPLPGSQKEVAAIAEIFRKKGWTGNVFLQTAATETIVKSVEKPAVIHLATHGYFLENGETGKFQQQVLNQNPLLRSMLFFAGAKNFLEKTGKNTPPASREDGILTAYEVQNLDLRGTELVVLSACNTGLGNIENGEGVFGLQRAFRVAGAQSVIMSLWEVDDAVTRYLMTNFYEKWLGGMAKGDAFRAAQRELKKEFPQPFFWGAFVMVGE